MTGLAVASSSQIAADAGAAIARCGGNAVDAAVAAVLVSMTTEPGVCSLGAGGFVTVAAPGAAVVTIDGNVEMPGRAAARRAGEGAWQVELGYGGGVTTVIGAGSTGTPGGLAALGLASRRYGRLPWGALLGPAIEHARRGFPLPRASHQYLVYSGESVYGWNPDSRAALFTSEGRLREAGETVRIDGLVESLCELRDEGIAALYGGGLGWRITEGVQAAGGLLTLEDLLAYRAQVRPSLAVELEGWQIATNPPPAIGGSTLAAMLILMRGRPQTRWTAGEGRYLVDVQRLVLGWRRERLDLSEDLGVEVDRLLRACHSGELHRALGSASTVHTSAVDAQGLGCAITMSAGYGSGFIAPGTGIWLNNCLGELELNRRGFALGPPGTRLPSNMAPTLARRDDGAILAIGSPGADRITTAILQTLVNFGRLHMDLAAAIEQPRAHVSVGEAGTLVACEPGFPLEAGELPLRRFEEKSMYFGGVAAAMRNAAGGLEAAADSRRTGGTALV